MRTPPSFFREQIHPFWALHRGEISPIWLAQRRASPHLLPWVWLAPFPGKMPGLHGNLHWPRCLHKCEAAAFTSRVHDVGAHTPQQVCAIDGARVRPDGRTLPLMTSSMTPGCWELPHALRLDCWRASPICCAVEMPANGPTTGVQVVPHFGATVGNVMTLARAIREIPGGAALPLLLLSAIGQLAPAESRAWFHGHLLKPTKPTQLFEAIRGLFRAAEPTATATSTPRPATRSSRSTTRATSSSSSCTAPSASCATAST